MKTKLKIDIGIGITYLLTATLFLLFPLCHITNIKWIILISFSIVSLLSLTQFIINKKTKDYTGLYTFVAILLLALSALIVDVKIPKNLAMCLMGWVILLSLIKLKKSDYYHDRKDRMWKLNLIMLGIFILSGILTSINLYHESSVQLIIIGFFLFVNGILDIMDPIVKSLIS